MLIAIAAGFCAGVVSQLCWPVLPCAWALAHAALLAGCAGWRAAGGAARAVAALVAGIAAGMGVSAWQAQAVLQARLPVSLEGRALAVEGTVGELRQHADGSIAFTLRVTRVPWRRVAELPAGAGLRLSSFDPLPVADGERWRLVVRLRRPHAELNPGGPDFERIAFGDRQLGNGSVLPSEFNAAVASPGFLRALRNRSLANLAPFYGAGPGDVAADEATRFARAVLPALLLDDRSLLTPAHWQVLASTGTAHLVAISGLHVSLLWGAVLVGLGALRAGRAPVRRYDAWTVLPALGVATFYAFVAGLPLPAERAVWMLALASAFILWTGQLPGWRVLLLTTALVLAHDPLAVHGAGFWLSHGAVGVLVLLAGLQVRGMAPPGWRGWLLEGARVQLLVTVLLFPPLFALFGSASVSGVLANLPAVPLVNLVALPAGLLALVAAPLFPSLADRLVDLACGALALLWRWLAWVDGLDALAPWRFDGASMVAVAVLGVAIFLALLRPLRGSVALAALLALAVLPASSPLSSGEAEACVLDAGQGVSVLVRTRHHAVLYDDPDGGRDDASAVRAFVPVAGALGVRRLDLLVSGSGPPGAGLAHAFLPATVLTAVSTARNPAAPACTAAYRRVFDGVEVTVLPGAPAGTDRRDGDCVLRVRASGEALLVAGGISARREIDLAAAYRDGLRADVLVASRHGSRAAGSATFLATVRPTHVVFATGYRNRHGYPHARVVNDVERLGAVRWNTARDGAVCARLGAPGSGVHPVAARDGTRRFWRDRSALPRAGEGRGLVVD